MDPNAKPRRHDADNTSARDGGAEPSLGSGLLGLRDRVDSRFDHQATDFWLQLVGVRDLRSVIVDNAWNHDRQQSEVSLAKGEAALVRLVDWFLNQ
jgi:hypothetical protein